MSEIFLPGKIIYGKDSLGRLSLDEHGHTLIISDGSFVETRGFLSAVTDRAKRTADKVSVIVNGNIGELYEHSSELFFSDEFDSIIAVGGAGVIDCAMLLSKESDSPFTAIPTCSACAVTDFDGGGYYSYRKSPECVVLDPQLMHCVSSGAVAYEGLACLAFAADALCESSDPIIHSMSFDCIAGIMKNIVPSFRGNMNAMENLMYSMYAAVVAHRNTKSAERSLANQTASFFSEFGYSKPAVLAVCIPSIIENNADVLKDDLCRLAFTLNMASGSESKEMLAAKMTDEIRRIQASLSVPRSISGFGLDAERFNAEKHGSSVPTDLLDLCFNGSFKFMKI